MTDATVTFVLGGVALGWLLGLIAASLIWRRPTDNEKWVRNVMEALITARGEADD